MRNTTPLYLKLLSYLVEIPLESLTTRYNQQVEVKLSGGRVSLNTKNATYSFEDKYRCFKTAFELINIKRRKTDDILILGYGLGSIPVILQKSYNKTCRYDAVEIDADIINLAKKYGPGVETGSIKYYNKDAMDFLETNNDFYDLIAVDLFLDDMVPEKFNSTDFLAKLDSHLKTGGVLLFNRLAHTSDAFNETLKYYESAFLKIFPGGRKLNTGGNLVLFYEKKG